MIVSGSVTVRAAESRDLTILYSWESPDMRGDFQEFKFQSMVDLQKAYEKDGLCSETAKVLIVERDGIQAGLVYLNFPRAGLVRMGLVLATESRNSGTGTEVLSIMIRHVWDNYPAVRIEADTDTENACAQRVLEKAGFIREGLLRQYRFHHGRYHDCYIYSLIRQTESPEKYD